MKTNAFAMIPAILLQTIFASHANAGELVVKLTGIPNGKGHLRIALYDDAERWANDVDTRNTLKSCQCVLAGKKAVDGKVTLAFKGKPGAYPIIIPAKDAKDGGMTITITGLKPGQYAVSLFHDQNDDKTMNMEPFLLLAESPAEPYGLSKNFNPMKSLRAPKFNDCSFAVGAGQVTQDIVLR